MPKGFFTQSACVLLSKTTSLDAIAELLTDFQIVKRVDQPTSPDFSGPALILAFRPEVNGYISVDLRNRKWPDHMGDPTTEPNLCGAWSMGFYGPFAFPGSLSRAQQQLWTWPEGKDAVESHAAMIQISISYVFGAKEQAPVMPPDYKALPELEFLTRVVLALLKHPAALAYFNPNGEILANDNILRKSLDYHAQHQIPPFDIWSNVRLLNPNNGWMIMDTVGMAQLDRPDLEACFPAKAFDLGKVSYFLRNCSLYLLQNGEVVKDKDTMNGPGDIKWQAHHVKKELWTPPRRLIRWFPLSGAPIPSEMRGEEQKSSDLAKPSLGKRIVNFFGKSNKP